MIRTLNGEANCSTIKFITFKIFLINNKICFDVMNIKSDILTPIIYIDVMDVSVTYVISPIFQVTIPSISLLKFIIF